MMFAAFILEFITMRNNNNHDNNNTRSSSSSISSNCIRSIARMWIIQTINDEDEPNKSNIIGRSRSLFQNVNYDVDVLFK